MGVQKVVEGLIDKALVLDDKQYTGLKMIAKKLYASGFDHLAEAIEKKVVGVFKNSERQDIQDKSFFLIFRSLSTNSI
ncbi:MAG: hypothetical protein ACHQUC_07285 [Chlamydiales bacterium]